MCDAVLAPGCSHHRPAVRVGHRCGRSRCCGRHDVTDVAQVIWVHLHRRGRQHWQRGGRLHRPLGAPFHRAVWVFKRGVAGVAHPLGKRVTCARGLWQDHKHTHSAAFATAITSQATCGLPAYRVRGSRGEEHHTTQGRPGVGGVCTPCASGTDRHDPCVHGVCAGRRCCGGFQPWQSSQRVLCTWAGVLANAGPSACPTTSCHPTSVSIVMCHPPRTPTPTHSNPLPHPNPPSCAGRMGRP